jgi:hypothetical protein
MGRKKSHMIFHLDEQEIGIAINAADTFAVVTVTGYPMYLRKLEQLAAKYPEAYKLTHEETDENGAIYCRQYHVEKKYIKFGKPASEARKEVGRRLAANMRANNDA